MLDWLIMDILLLKNGAPPLQKKSEHLKSIWLAPPAWILIAKQRRSSTKKTFRSIVHCDIYHGGGGGGGRSPFFSFRNNTWGSCYCTYGWQKKFTKNHVQAGRTYGTFICGSCYTIYMVWQKNHKNHVQADGWTDGSHDYWVTPPPNPPSPLPFPLSVLAVYDRICCCWLNCAPYHFRMCTKSRQVPGGSRRAKIDGKSHWPF